MPSVAHPPPGRSYDLLQPPPHLGLAYAVSSSPLGGPPGAGGPGLATLERRSSAFGIVRGASPPALGVGAPPPEAIPIQPAPTRPQSSPGAGWGRASGEPGAAEGPSEDLVPPPRKTATFAVPPAQEVAKAVGGGGASGADRSSGAAAANGNDEGGPASETNGAAATAEGPAAAAPAAAPAAASAAASAAGGLLTKRPGVAGKTRMLLRRATLSPAQLLPDLAGMAARIRDEAKRAASTAELGTKVEKALYSKYYNEEAMARRLELMADPDIVRMLERLWEATDIDGSHSIEREEYLLMHKKLVLSLDPSIGPRQARKTAEEDWDKDSEGKKSLDRERFFRCMFELADLWVDSLQPSAYVDFLTNALQSITRTDAKGNTSWASDRACIEGYLRNRTKGSQNIEAIDEDKHGPYLFTIWNASIQTDDMARRLMMIEQAKRGFTSGQDAIPAPFEADASKATAGASFWAKAKAAAAARQLQQQQQQQQQQQSPSPPMQRCRSPMVPRAPSRPSSPEDGVNAWIGVAKLAPDVRGFVAAQEVQGL